MAVAAQHDDDLLIIADDSESSQNDGDIEFSFDFSDTQAPKEEATVEAKLEEVAEVVTQEPETSISVEDKQVEPEISLDIESEAPAEKQVVDVAEAVVEQATDNELGLSLDLDTEEKVEVKTEEPKVETPVVDEDFSFDIESSSDDAVTQNPVVENTQEAPISTTEEVVSDSNSMNDILSATIAKLISRQEAIGADKASKASKEEELKAKIKELQAQVGDLEAEMKDLDSESSKITANIAELENMKLDPVKEHNAKRAKK